PPERDVQPRRDAPGAAPDDRPGHDLVEQRAHDAAVGDGFPALEARLEVGLRPGAGRIRVDREAQPLLIELAAGEAAMRLELEGAVAITPGRTPGGPDRRSLART